MGRIAIAWDFDNTLYLEREEWKAIAIPELTREFARRFYGTETALDDIAFVEDGKAVTVREQYEIVFFKSIGSHNTTWSSLQKVPRGFDISRIRSSKELEKLVELPEFCNNPADPSFVEDVISIVDKRDFHQPDEEIVEMFQRYRIDHPEIEHYIFSNSTGTAVLTLMQHLKIDSRQFRYMFFLGSKDMKKKPDLSGYIRLLEIANLEPKNLVYVGDSEEKDVKPANEVGLTTVKAWHEKGKPTAAKYAIYHPKETLEIDIIKNRR